MTGKLVLLRHGQSVWNVENLFTGWHDVDLSDQGREEARQAGRELEASDHAKGRGLAVAGRPEQHDELTFVRKPRTIVSGKSRFGRFLTMVFTVFRDIDGFEWIPTQHHGQLTRSGPNRSSADH